MVRDERSNPNATWVRHPSSPTFHSERVRNGGLIFVAESVDPLGLSKARGDVPDTPPERVSRRDGLSVLRA